ncbi:Crp/Fnr family transcriptional regulator [Ruminococcus sp.]|jgi:CRP/FNR family cyclic AMP-dependent transcriptional regulator|uniref:Crp/Fnr family transcriptional regulator n=2 Tax=Ruminococcus TaxID=1263 RepID=UPI002665977F|nr:Crp/Fnr family transcriptional regulator [uncultured Ruminococcus sp.]
MEKNLNTPPTQLYNIHNDMKTLFDSLPYTKSFAKGEIIYHQGDIADSFYYIKKGKATVFMISPDGMEKTLNTAAKGELIGEGAFFDHKPRVSSAKAVTASELTIIDKKILLDLIQKNPPIAFELLEILATRIRLLTTQLDSMTFMQADARIAKLLLDDMVNGKVSLTHEEIALAVGVSRITVTKALSRLSAQGILATHYRGIKILDKAGLEKICGEK